MTFALLAMVYAAAPPPAMDARSVFQRVQAGVVTVRTPTGVGSGFVIGDGRTVVTCHHVVEDSPETITIKGQSARILAQSVGSDVAVLRVAKRLGSPLRISSVLPKPGTKIYVVGNPLGMLEKTISEGIVSGLRRVQGTDYVQITAPISEGSSGGPVVDSRGNVVAMVAMFLEEGQALNFAIASPTLRKVAAQANAVVKRGDKAPVEGPEDRLRRLTRQANTSPDAWTKLIAAGKPAVPHILRELGSPTEEGGVKIQMVLALIEIGEPAKAPLLNALANGPPFQRFAVCAALAVMAAIIAPDAMLTTNSDRDQRRIEFRRSYAERVAYIRGQDVVRGLRRALQRRDADLGSHHAARALGYLEAKSATDDLISATKVADSQLAVDAFGALVCLLGPSDYKIVHGAFAQILSGSTDDDVDEDGENKRLAKMAEHLANTRTAVGRDLLLELLRHDDEEVRYQACVCLTSREIPEAMPILKALLDEPEEDVKRAALAAIGFLGKGEMMDRMIEATRSPNEYDRSWGAYAIGLSRNSAGLDAVVALAADQDKNVRRAAAEALGILGGSKALTALRKLSSDASDMVRMEARLALEKLRE